MNNNRLTLYKEEIFNISEDLDIEQFTFSQPHLFSTSEITVQKIQKFKIFNPQHQATLGLVKLDGQIKVDNPNQIKHKNISKNKQTQQDSPKCPICGKKFSSPQAVGGHCSRTHPNESEKYQSKVAKREERKYELFRTRQLQIIVKHDLQMY